jgi:hypothetical protein
VQIPLLWGYYRRYGAHDGFAEAIPAALSVNMFAHVRSADNHIPDVGRPPDRGGATAALAHIRADCILSGTAGYASAIEMISNLLTGLLIHRGHAVNRADYLGFAQVEPGYQVLAYDNSALALLAILAVSVRYDSAKPRARLCQPVRPRYGSLANQLAFVRGEARQHRQHQSPGCCSRIEFLGQAAHTDAEFIQLRDAVQN